MFNVANVALKKAEDNPAAAYNLFRDALKNLTSLGNPNPARRDYIKAYVAEHKPSVIFLQEYDGKMFPAENLGKTGQNPDSKLEGYSCYCMGDDFIALQEDLEFKDLFKLIIKSSEGGELKKTKDNGSKLVKLEKVNGAYVYGGGSATWDDGPWGKDKQWGPDRKKYIADGIIMSVKHKPTGKIIMLCNIHAPSKYGDYKTRFFVPAVEKSQIFDSDGTEYKVDGQSVSAHIVGGDMNSLAKEADWAKDFCEVNSDKTKVFLSHKKTSGNHTCNKQRNWLQFQFDKAVGLKELEKAFKDWFVGGSTVQKFSVSGGVVKKRLKGGKLLDYTNDEYKKNKLPQVDMPSDHYPIFMNLTLKKKQFPIIPVALGIAGVTLLVALVALFTRPKAKE